MYSVPGKVKLRTFLRFTKQGPKTAQDEGREEMAEWGKLTVGMVGAVGMVGTGRVAILLPFRHSAIPPFYYHSARHSTIPPFCYHNAIP